jgi:UDP-GlcNAc:undecaprenyl-phosphate/decaprenyl-phosphate GlcNAc-1-phosphate transferase
MTFVLVASFVIALLSALVLTAVVRKLAVSHGWNGPSSAHHVHDGPVPRVGGIAIFCAVALAVSVTALTGSLSSTIILRAAGILLAGSLVFIVGLYDDFRPVKPWTKLLVETSAAAVLFAAGIRLDHLPLFEHPLPPLLSLTLTVLCVVGVTNAFNLIDGLDGLAAGTATVSAASFFALAFHRGDIVTAWLAVALVGAMSGFLRFNLNPARIFLGDCGSLFIGFVISASAIVGVRETTSVQMLAVPILAIGLPALDTLLAIVRRCAKGSPIFVPDREHIHHKLLDRGHSHRSAVLILYAFSGLFGSLALALTFWQRSFPVLVVLCCATSTMVVYLGYHRLFRRARVRQDRPEFKPAPAPPPPMPFQAGTSRLRQLTTFPELWRTLDGIFSVDDCLGYDLSIPAPVAGIDLRHWGFVLADQGTRYVHCSHSGGDLNGSRGSACQVQLAMRKQAPDGVLSIYLRRPLEMPESCILPAFSSALSDGFVRILNTARKQNEPGVHVFGSVLAALRADHSGASGSAD